LSSGATFNKYVIPKVPITASAQTITKVTMKNEMEMLLDGKPVEAVPIQHVLNYFFSWIEKFNGVFLVAHNGIRFDYVVLTNFC